MAADERVRHRTRIDCSHVRRLPKLAALLANGEVRDVAINDPLSAAAIQVKWWR
ncbi:MAG: hypothetical protein OJF51_000542 [Nitrospira sp.]|jgi:hypothetical protein|nr:MAG: hypothetical protein OJF51_000542 [Nitrospira sp.]